MLAFFKILLLLLTAAHDASGDPVLEMRNSMDEPYLIAWDVVGEDTTKTARIVSALVNQIHNSSCDVALLPGRSGSIKLSQGWSVEGKMHHADFGVGFLRGNVELFLCPHAYQQRGLTMGISASEMLSASGCAKVDEHHFHVIELHFKSNVGPKLIHMPLPFTGARMQILAALPPGTALPVINRVLDYVRSVTFTFLERLVLHDEALMNDWFGGDEEFQEALRSLCAETMPDPAGLEQTFKHGNPTYAHKLGALVMAVSAFDLQLCVETGALYGETAFHLAAACDTVFTVELSSSLAARLRSALPVARERFRRNITLLEGNSGELLRDPRIQADPRPALFWLDGHFSAGVTAHLDPAAHRHFGAPVLDELRAVFARENEGDVIVVDDTQAFFHPSAGYPSVRDILGLVCEAAPTWRVQVREEGIRIFKRRAPPALPNACIQFGGYGEEVARERGEDLCRIGGWGAGERAADEMLLPPEL